MTLFATIIRPATASLLTAFLLAAALSPRDALANVYASQLKITNPDGSQFDRHFNDGTGALLTFILNDDATSVRITIKEAETDNLVDEIEVGAASRGRVEVPWDGTGTEDNRFYVFEVTAEQENRSNTEWTMFYDSGDINIFTRGADVVRNMDSPRFGIIFAPNSGGPLGKGVIRYTMDGEQHEPFLVAADVSSGGTVDWGSGSDSIFSGVLDEKDRFYVSAVTAGEVRRLNTDNTLTTVVSGLENPKGLWLAGEGADRVLYIADNDRVVRAAIGNDDVFTGDVEVVAQLSKGFPRNIAVDDDGALYVALRETNGFASASLGLAKYDLSGDLPVTEDDVVWWLREDITFRVTSLEIDFGSDRSTADDDILYYSTRAGNESTADGIWRVDDIHSVFTDVTQLIGELEFYGGISDNINDRAAIKLDAAGNLILMENSYEHIFFISPPGEGATNSFTTVSAQFGVGGFGMSAEDEGLPGTYRLDQNYPNPFNPSTSISYTLGSDGFTTVRVYNLTGQEVRTLVAQHQPSGRHHVEWDGRDEQGRALGSGVYLLVVSSGTFNQSIRMALVK